MKSLMPSDKKLAESVHPNLIRATAAGESERRSWRRMDMQMHRHEDRGMFSQCFCDHATPRCKVAEMLRQHLSLLDSENGREETVKKRGQRR